MRLMLRYQPDLPKRVGIAAGTRELTEPFFAYGMNASYPDWLGRGAKAILPADPPWAAPPAWASRRGHAEIAQLPKQHGAE